MATPNFTSRRTQSASFLSGGQIIMTQVLDVNGDENLLLVGITHGETNGPNPGGPVITGVTVDGNAMVLESAISEGNARAEVWSFNDDTVLVAGSPVTVIITGPFITIGETHNMVAFFDLYNDVDQDAPIRKVQTKTSTGTPIDSDTFSLSPTGFTLVGDIAAIQVGLDPVTTTQGINFIDVAVIKNTGVGGAVYHIIGVSKIGLKLNPVGDSSATLKWDGVASASNEDWAMIVLAITGSNNFGIPVEPPPVPIPPKAEISPPFAAFQAVQTTEPRSRLLAVLQNVAAQTEGAVATASGEDASGNFPAAGANEGDATTLNVGAAATAENGIGKASWKSGDASVTTLVTTKANFLDKDHDAVVTSDVPTAYWRMGDAAGPTVLDETAGNHDGTAVNAPTFAVAGLLGEPDADTAITFNGSTQYVTVPDDAAWNFTNLTIEALVIYTGGGPATPRKRIISQSNAGLTEQWAIAVRDGIAEIVIVQNGETFTEKGGPLLTDGRIHHIVGVRDIANKLLKLYVDGIEVVSVTIVEVAAFAIAGTVDIGRLEPGNQDHFPGTIDEVAVYPVAFTLQQVSDHFHSARALTARIGDSVQIAHLDSPKDNDTVAEQDDFDDAAEGVALGGRNNWVADFTTGASLIDTVAVAAFGGAGKGVHLFGGASTGNTQVHLPVTFTGQGKVVCSFKFNVIDHGNAGAGTDEWHLAFATAGARLFTIGSAGTNQGAGTPAELRQSTAALLGTAGVLTELSRFLTVNKWRRMFIEMDVTAGLGSVPTKVLLSEIDSPTRESAEMVFSQTLNLTGMDRIRLFVNNVAPPAAPRTSVYIDDFSIGNTLTNAGVREKVIDLTQVPVSGRATLEFNGHTRRVEQQIAGLKNSLNNNNASRKVRDVAANTERGQTVTPTGISVVNAIWLHVQKVGTPSGNIWLEIQEVDGSNLPNGTILATSKSINVDGLTVGGALDDITNVFEFPDPYTTVAARIYGVVFKSDITISGANHIEVLSDSSGALYTGGTAVVFDGAVWTTQAFDHGFVGFQWLQIETFYDIANQDTDQPLGETGPNRLVSQSFKVPFDFDAQTFQAYLKIPTGVTFSAGDRFFAEIRTGLPDLSEPAVAEPAADDSEQAWLENPLVGADSASALNRNAANQLIAQTFQAPSSALISSLTVELQRFGVTRFPFGGPVTISGPSIKFQIRTLNPAVAAGVGEQYDPPVLIFPETNRVFGEIFGVRFAQTFTPPAETYSKVRVKVHLITNDPRNIPSDQTIHVRIYKGDPGVEGTGTDSNQEVARSISLQINAQLSMTPNAFVEFLLSSKFRPDGVSQYSFAIFSTADGVTGGTAATLDADNIGPPNTYAGGEHWAKGGGVWGKLITVDMPFQFIRDAQIESPTNTVLGETPIMFANEVTLIGQTGIPTTPTILNFPFSTKPNLISGQRYGIVMISDYRPAVVAGLGYVNWRLTSTDTFASGRALQFNTFAGGGTWQIISSTDFTFILFKDGTVLLGGGQTPGEVFQTAEVDPNLLGVAGGAYVLWSMTLPQKFRILAGTTYYLILRGNWGNGGSTKFLHVGTDSSAPSYADGQVHLGDDGDPTVWTGIDADMVFAVLGEHIPFIRWLGAYSTDDGLTDEYISERITDNPTRTGSLVGTDKVDFFAAEKRFWRITAEFHRKTPDGVNLSWSPILLDFTVVAVFVVEQTLTIDFGSTADFTREIDYIEIYSHSDAVNESGARAVVLSGKATDAASLAEITDIDDELLESRKKNGRSIAFRNGDTDSLIRQDGEFMGIHFSKRQTLAELEISVRDNVVGFAHIVEVRCYRVEDFTPRIVSMKISADSKFTRRLFEAKTLSLTLENADFFLSVLRTEGGFNTQLGDGVRFKVWVGFLGVELRKQGEFFVSAMWSEDPKSAKVKVSAKDLIHQIDTTVQPKLRINFRHHEIIEYLANLTGVPSQDMIIDRSASIVDFFAGKEINAWQEIQKVAEAAGFGQVSVDEFSVLVYRGTGNTARDTKLEVITGVQAGNKERFMGPLAELDGKLYGLMAWQSEAATSQVELMEYDIATTVWTNKGEPVTGKSVDRHQAFPVAYLGDLYILDFDDVNDSTFDLVRWDGATFTTVAKHSISFQLHDQAIVNYIVKDSILYFCGVMSQTNWTGKGLQKLNLNSFAFSEGTGIAGENIDFILEESGVFVVITRRESDDAIRVYEWDRVADTFTFKLDFGSLKFWLVGATATQKGYFFVQMTAWNDAADSEGVLFKVTVPGFISTKTEVVYKDGQIEELDEGNGDAVVYSDGLVVSGALRKVGSGFEGHAMTHDEREDSSVLLGPLDFGVANMRHFMTAKFEGQDFIYGVLELNHVFELQVRRPQTLTDDERIVITGDPLGNLIGASLESGNRTGGEYHIINDVIVRSRPLVSFPKEQVWEQRGLPRSVRAGKTYRYQIEYKEDVLDPDQDDVDNSVTRITFSDGGVGTNTTDQIGVRRAEVVLTITTNGTLELAEIDRKPLKQAASRITLVVGNASLRGRYLVKTFPIDNDYVYNALDAVVMAGGILSRLQHPHIRLINIQVTAQWDIKRFDRVKFTYRKLGLVDEDFSVAGYRHEYKTQKTTLDLIRLANTV